MPTSRRSTSKPRLTDLGPPYGVSPVSVRPQPLADALRACGIDVCVLANNHCCDGGTEGIRTTLRTLDRAGIGRTGVFADSCDLRRHHPLRLRAGEVEVALLDYTYGTNGIPVPHGALVNRTSTRPPCAATRTGPGRRAPT